MCRSIVVLRPQGSTREEPATPEEIRAAALQYVRKVSGYRMPSAANRAVFDRAVDEVAAATERLLEELVVRGRAERGAVSGRGNGVP